MEDNCTDKTSGQNIDAAILISVRNKAVTEKTSVQNIYTDVQLVIWIFESIEIDPILNLILLWFSVVLSVTALHIMTSEIFPFHELIEENVLS